MLEAVEKTAFSIAKEEDVETAICGEAKPVK